MSRESSSPTPTLAPSHEAIAARAYVLWEQRGRRPGEAEETWLEAERELQAAGSPDEAEQDLRDPRDASSSDPTGRGD